MNVTDIINYTAGPLCLVVMICAFFSQAFLIKDNAFVFKVHSYNKKIFTIALAGIFLALYIIIGVVVEYHVTNGGATIFELTLNYTSIIVSSLILGPFYGAVIAFLGNTAAFFISGGTGGGFSFWFPLSREIAAIFPFFVLLSIKLLKKNFIFITKTFLFMFFSGVWIVSLLFYQNIIPYFLKSEIHERLILILILTFTTILYFCILLFLLGSRFWYSYFLKKEVISFKKLYQLSKDSSLDNKEELIKTRIKTKYLILTISFLCNLCLVIWLSLITDPIGLHLINDIDYSALYILRIGFLLISFFVNVYVTYYVTYFIVAFVKNDFIINRFLKYNTNNVLI